MKIEDRILHLENNYVPYKNYHLNSSTLIYLGNETERICRFCNKNESEVSFNNISHAIPEFVNNPGKLLRM